ncbi:hypothetical protein GGS26DRAFT_562339 [Hypomontagnella submonticulosa]|nr:hypothetical protein GGS26DRAFT_562339 [Hypomontagnella submonticulosa]
MVSFKKLALVGAASALFSAVCGMPTDASSKTALGVRDMAVAEFEAPERRAPEVIPESDGVTKRVDIRMRLWWSQGGQVLFLIGRNLNVRGFPQELSDLVAGHTEGAPGQMLLQNFYNFIQRRHSDVYEWLTEQLPPLGTQIGAMWGTAERRGDFGFAINIPGGWTNPGTGGAGLLQRTVDAINDWASQNGAAHMVAIQQRANGFFNPADIGAGNPHKLKRSRTDQCPKDYNVLKIADEVVPNDVDFKKYYRWTEPCK